MKRIWIKSVHKYILVDNKDFKYVNQYTWHLSRGYATSRVKNTPTRLHRFLLNPKKNELTDHINRNKLDNRRQNLRISTHKQNMSNRIKQSNNSSGYKGVRFLRDCDKWSARISKDGRINLGIFRSKIQAARAYDKAALKIYGKFACINFPSKR